MAFVNENISEEDYIKYGLKEIDHTISPPGIPGHSIKRRDWTIDRDRNIFLREFASGRYDEEEDHLTGWTFFWKGELLWFVYTGISNGGVRNGPQWGSSRITNLLIPDHLRCNLKEIQEDIREAFQVYAGGGVYRNATEYREEIDFDIDK